MKHIHMQSTQPNMREGETERGKEERERVAGEWVIVPNAKDVHPS